MYWSPEGSYLTTLDEDGTLKVSNNIMHLYDNSYYFCQLTNTLSLAYNLFVVQLWDMKEEVPSLAHSFDAYSTNTVTWHPEVSGEGDMLLARYMRMARCTL